MKTSVVILNWNGRRHLEHFLPSVVAFSGEAEVVVADNGSTDDSVEFLRARFPSVRLILLDYNYGYAEGYNRALARIESDYYLILNSDIRVGSGWLTPLEKVLDGDPTVAAVSPKIRSYSCPERFEYAGAAGGFIDFLGYPFCRGRILGAIEEDDGQYDDSREVFWTSGACMLIRSRVFHELGGFDARFFAHMEEIDLCWRIQLDGMRLMVEPRSKVFHVGGGTLPNDNPHKIYLNYRNNLAMLFKNLSGNSFSWVLFVRMILDGLSAGVFLLQGKGSFCRAVFRAHRDYSRWRPELRKQREEIQAARRVPHTRNIFRGSIVLRYLLGRRAFGDMM